MKKKTLLRNWDFTYTRYDQKITFIFKFRELHMWIFAFFLLCWYSGLVGSVLAY